MTTNGQVGTFMAGLILFCVQQVLEDALFHLMFHYNIDEKKAVDSLGLGIGAVSLWGPHILPMPVGFLWELLSPPT